MSEKTTQSDYKKLRPPPKAPTERGQRTRRKLMNAALQLMEQGRSFNSLSMREVTSAAGVVPSAFYRHFKDMNELGLSLVDDVGRTLRPALRQARLESGYARKDIIRNSLLAYKKYVEEHSRYFMVAAGERHGGSPVIREAIAREVDLFTDELVQDLRELELLPNMSQTTLRNVCDLVVNTMLSAASDILDLRKSSRGVAEARMETYVQQLRVIFMGASMWREKEACAD